MTESCGLHFGKYFFFKYFLRIPFVRERYQKGQAIFGATGMSGLTNAHTDEYPCARVSFFS